MRIATKLILLALLLVACDELPVSLPEPTAVSVSAAEMAMMVGDAAPVAAQVVDQNGQVIRGLAPVFSTDNPAVATVDTAGMVRAVAPGTANISAAYGGSSARVRVTVAPDRRSALQSLEVLADSVVADVRAGPQSVAVRAANGYGFAVCPDLTFRSSDATVATARMAGACRIEVVPAFAGEAIITVEAEGGRTDTFRVRVTSIEQIAFFSARPAAAELVPGATLTYTVRVMDESGAGLAGQRVNLDVSVGSLSATALATGSDGTATVTWSIPAHLPKKGPAYWISLRAPLPNGTVAADSERVFLIGDALAEILVYVNGVTSSGFSRVDPEVRVFHPGGFGIAVGAVGGDQYGNTLVTDFKFAVGAAWWGCGREDGVRLPSGMEYTCFSAPHGYGAMLRISAPDGQSRTVNVYFYDDRPPGRW